MKKEMSAKPFVIVASLAVAILCAYSVANDAKTPVPGGMASTNAAVKVDFDFDSRSRSVIFAVDMHGRV